jgi:hypothetical protein
MITYSSLRKIIRILIGFIDRALNAGYELHYINKAILFDSVSSRNVAQMTASSHQTINRMATKLLTLFKTSPDIKFLELSDAELLALFYPKLKNKVSYKRRPPFEMILKEATKRPKKLALKIKTIYLMYREEDPSTALGISQFYTLIKQEIAKSKIEYIFTYTPGEVLAADYAGVQLIYYPNSPKQPEYLSVFVCVLGYSNKMFAIATKRHTTKQWVNSIVAGLDSLGGCPFTIHVDNGEMVKKAGLIAELNEQAECMAAHYNVIVDTSRVAMSQDNPKAEKTVQFITYRILVPMRRLHFTSIEEVNAHLSAEVEKLNNEPMQRIKLSRNQLFNMHEKSTLKALPQHPYRPFDERFPLKVSANATITYKGNRYSVPYTIRHHKVIVEITEDELTVFNNYKVVATHQIAQGVNNDSILDAHKSPQHLVQGNKNKSNFIEWAQGIDESAAHLIERQYKNVNSDNSNPAGKACIMIQKQLKRFNEPDFILACQYADEHQITSAQEFKMVMETEIYRDIDNNKPFVPLLLANKNVRGAQYYGE